MAQVIIRKHFEGFKILFLRLVVFQNCAKLVPNIEQPGACLFAKFTPQSFEIGFINLSSAAGEFVVAFNGRVNHEQLMLSKYNAPHRLTEEGFGFDIDVLVSVDGGE